MTSLSDYDDMRELLTSANVIVGHNLVRYDVKLLEKILEVDIKAKLYDTLPMSWVMFPNRNEHGLDSFGKDYGVPKPKVDDWQNLTYEEYKHRCEEDVKINFRLWEDLIKRFRLVYREERDLLDKYLQYLTFKMKCASMAEQARWKLDVDLAKTSLETLTRLQEEKVEELKGVMPKVKKFKEKKKPKQTYKKDGNLTKLAEDWFKLLDENGYSRDFEGPVKVLDKEVEPNPNSSDQVKDWLFSMGWKPCTFDYKKNDDGSERKIPQVRKEGELAPSVVVLSETYPEVQLLEGLTVIQHRKAIFEGLLESVDEEGYVKAEIAGLTNTLRFKHKKPLVNLPGVDKPWGKEVRGCLIAAEGEVLCGADMVSLEDTTKRHFIKPYDPELVEEQSKPDYDPHLKLAVVAGTLSQEDYEFYVNDGKEKDNDRYKRIHGVRKKAKTVTYSALYGVGKAKLARTTGMSEQEAEKLLKAFWKINWAVLEVASNAEKKTVNGQMWVRNPVNNYWYSLRHDKDVWSTLNQGTGAYCFDQWLAYGMSGGLTVCFQAHDELVSRINKCEKEWLTELLKRAVGKVNKKLKLNVELDVDVQYGGTYADVH